MRPQAGEAQCKPSEQPADGRCSSGIENANTCYLKFITQNNNYLLKFFDYCYFLVRRFMVLIFARQPDAMAAFSKISSIPLST